MSTKDSSQGGQGYGSRRGGGGGGGGRGKSTSSSHGYTTEQLDVLLTFLGSGQREGFIPGPGMCPGSDHGRSRGYDVTPTLNAASPDPALDTPVETAALPEASRTAGARDRSLSTVDFALSSSGWNPDSQPDRSSAPALHNTNGPPSSFIRHRPLPSNTSSGSLIDTLMDMDIDKPFTSTSDVTSLDRASTSTSTTPQASSPNEMALDYPHPSISSAATPANTAFSSPSNRLPPPTAMFRDDELVGLHKPWKGLAASMWSAKNEGN